jgi:hypothetical protein
MSRNASIQHTRQEARDLLDAGESTVPTGGPGNQLYRGEGCIRFG